MYKNQKDQENNHLTEHELVEFITNKEYKPGMLENSAPVIFHLVNCDTCRKMHEYLMRCEELHGRDFLIRNFGKNKTDEKAPGI